MSKPLWAVTCLFNPERYQRRALNYRRFRERLGVPLLSVELSFDGRFELQPRDADVLVQLTGGDVMWQKERLLNIGVSRLPAQCTAVAILDSDIIFDNHDWPEASLRALETSIAVQPFEVARFLDVETSSEQRAAEPITQHSVASLVASGHRPGQCLGAQRGEGRGRASPGLAWVYRRAFLERHGLFEACIIGGGDTAVACASWGAYDAVEERHAMNEGQRRWYRAWADPWRQAIDGRVGWVPGGLSHLWHGDLANRQAAMRHAGLSVHAFDPARDIVGRPHSAWQWASEKVALHRYVRDYFVARREDG